MIQLGGLIDTCHLIPTGNVEMLNIWHVLCLYTGRAEQADEKFKIRTYMKKLVFWKGKIR